jgi:hypothetical protein
MHTAPYRTGRAPHKELWVESITPLVLEAFAIHLWATPIANSLMDKIPTILTLEIVLFVTCATFGVNLCIHPYVHRFLAKPSLSDSPLFRSVWIFICASAVTRYTGTGGIMQFTLVALLPLVYVRVPHLLASCAAVFALLFLVLVAVHNIAFFFAERPSPPESLSHNNVNSDGYELATHSTVFVFASVYHIIWFASHSHGSNTPNQPSSHWKSSTIHHAIFRTLLVGMLSVLVNSGRTTEQLGVTYKYHGTVEILQIVALFVTISTFSSWTHCQHKNHNRLRTIVCSSVTAATSGILQVNMEQQAFMWVVFTFGVIFDVVYRTDTPPAKHHGA